MNNNPITYADPDGDIAPLIWAGIAVGGGLLNVWKNADNIKSVTDGLVAFGIGAGAAVLATVAAPTVSIGATYGATIASYAAAGAISGGVGGAVEGLGNGIYFGKGDIGDRVFNGVTQGLKDGIKGALLGAGMGAGIGAGAHWFSKVRTPKLPPGSAPDNLQPSGTDDGVVTKVHEDGSFDMDGDGWKVPGKLEDADLGRKLDYAFGKGTGNTHNIQRSKTMLRQLESVGIFDNPNGTVILENHLKQAFKGSTGVLQSNGRYLRNSFLMGPNGGLGVESIWEKSRLITIKLFGGK